MKKKTIEELKTFVNENNSDAMVELGRRYYTGNGVQKNYELALKYFQMAETAGNIRGRYQIAICYYFGRGVKKDYEKAYNIFYDLMTKYDDKDSKGYVGFMYYFGHYVNRDYEKAYNIFKALADNGDVIAKTYIADMYYFGRYLSKDYKKAFEMYKNLYEEHNDKYSVTQLIACYYFGRGTEKDYKKVREYGEWFEQKNNDIYVAYYLGQIYFLGRETEKDYKKAIMYFEKSNTDDYDDSYYNLGLIYQSGGYGIEKDEQKAKEYFYKIEMDLCSSVICYILAFLEEENFEEKMIGVLNTKRETLMDALTIVPKEHLYLQYFKKLQCLNNESYLDIVNRLKAKVYKFIDFMEQHNFIKAVGSKEEIEVFSRIIVYSSEYNTLNEFCEDMIKKGNRKVVDFINKLEHLELNKVTREIPNKIINVGNIKQNHFIDMPDYDLDSLNVYYERGSHDYELDKKDSD